MKKSIFLGVFVTGLTACGPTVTDSTDTAKSTVDKVATTTRGDHVDTYFGAEVPDPYRWLEDDLSSDTATWITDQNASTRSYIDAISLRDDVKNTVARQLNFERETAPFILSLIHI